MRRAERIERRQHENGGEDRIEAERRVDDISDVRAENDEGRMRDIDNVENAERMGHADRHCGVEAAEQQAGNDCIDEQFDRQDDASPDAVTGLL